MIWFTVIYTKDSDRMSALYAGITFLIHDRAIAFFKLKDQSEILKQYTTLLDLLND